MHCEVCCNTGLCIPKCQFRRCGLFTHLSQLCRQALHLITFSYTVKLCSSSIFDWSFRSKRSLCWSQTSSALGGSLSQVLHLRSRSLRPTPSGLRSHVSESVRIQSESSSETYIENHRFRFELLLCIVGCIFVDGKEALQILLDYVNRIETVVYHGYHMYDGL